MFCFFDCGYTGFDISNITEYPNHGDMLRTNTFQIKDANVSGLFSHISRGNHVYDFALNKSDRRKRNLGISKYLLADRSYPLSQKFKDAG